MPLTTTQMLEAALTAYAEKFDNLDELMHPAYMENPAFVEFLKKAAQGSVPATQEEIASALGEVDWEW